MKRLLIIIAMIPSYCIAGEPVMRGFETGMTREQVIAAEKKYSNTDPIKSSDKNRIVWPCTFLNDDEWGLTAVLDDTTKTAKIFILDRQYTEKEGDLRREHMQDTLDVLQKKYGMGNGKAEGTSLIAKWESTVDDPKWSIMWHCETRDKPRLSIIYYETKYAEKQNKIFDGSKDEDLEGL